jgi:hypothetical protein
VPAETGLCVVKRASAIVALHDVDDPIAFVRKAVQLSGLRLSADEREDLIAEGLLILYRMATSYRPGFGGRDPAGSRFSGYAIKYLPGKLREAWRRSQPGYVRTRQPDGRCRWERRGRAVSITAIRHDSSFSRILRTEDDELRQLVELQHDLRAALDRQLEVDGELTVRVGVLLASGWQRSEVAWLLRRSEADVRVCESRLRRIARRAGLPAPPLGAESHGEQLSLLG